MENGRTDLTVIDGGKRDHITEGPPRTVGELTELIRRMDPANHGFGADDLSTAMLFAKLFSSRTRFSDDIQRWMGYDGTAWREEGSDTSAARQAGAFAVAMENYASDVGDRFYQSYIGGLKKTHRRNSLISDARKYMTCHQQDFDQQPMLLNVLNGTIDLSTGKLLEHDPQQMLSQVAPVEYVDGAESPLFDKFIDDIMMGDAAETGYIQEMFGSCLTGTCEIERCFFLWGKLARNGKTTLANTLAEILGVGGGLYRGYATTLLPQALEVQTFRQANGHTEQIARLRDKRLILCSEAEHSIRIDAEMLKKISSHDLINARGLFESSVDFRVTGTLVADFNKMPIISDESVFAGRRVAVVPFTRHFREDECDLTLKAKLLEPTARSAILNWMLTGLKRLQEKGMRLTAPASVVDATEEYAGSCDKFRLFVSECLEEEPFSGVQAVDVFPVYRKWSLDGGMAPLGYQKFLAELRQRGMLSDTATLGGKTERSVIVGRVLRSDIERLPSPRKDQQNQPTS